jgi:5-methylcytosine-specific restriction endonuclease McrA
MARRNPQPGTRNRIRPLNAEHDELKVRLKKTVSKDLKRALALNPSCDLGQVVEKIIEFYLEHKDPVRKAERAEKRAERPTKTTPSEKFGPGRKRTPLVAKDRHTVNLRDGRRCTFVGADGKRCGDDRWTEIHHVIPLSLGGTNDSVNLTTLCSFHHDLVHQLSLPIEGQVNWLPEFASSRK